MNFNYSPFWHVKQTCYKTIPVRMFNFFRSVSMVKTTIQKFLMLAINIRSCISEEFAKNKCIYHSVLFDLIWHSFNKAKLMNNISDKVILYGNSGKSFPHRYHTNNNYGMIKYNIQNIHTHSPYNPMLS